MLLCYYVKLYIYIQILYFLKFINVMNVVNDLFGIKSIGEAIDKTVGAIIDSSFGFRL